MEMMDGPFYGRRYWNLPSRSHPRSNNTPSLRDIPIQFVGSGEKRLPSRSDSAVKIQKLFRGFLVRKNVKKIAGIKSEVEEIEKRMSNQDTIDLISRDSKERLRMNEMLMSLLFRLDSVRGVDSGVRDCRKAVIKKAIALQEILDAAVSSNDNKNDLNGVKVAEADDDQNPKVQMEITENGEKTEEAMDDDDDDKEAIESQSHVGDKEADENQINDKEAEEVVEEIDGDTEDIESQNDVGDKEAEKNQNNDGEAEEVVKEFNRDIEAIDSRNDVGDKEADKNQSNDVEAEEVVEDLEAMPSVNDGPEPEESAGASQTDSSTIPEACEEDENLSQRQENNSIETHDAEKVEENEEGSGAQGQSEENAKNREMLEKMMEDNERMMDLMAKLFERNEMQMRLLCSLSQRVSQLERAFMCERLRKNNKKRRNAKGNVVDDDCETTPGNKQFGKRE